MKMKFENRGFAKISNNTSELERGPNLSRPRRDFCCLSRDETLKLRDTRLQKPKIGKYKKDNNTLEYGLYQARLLRYFYSKITLAKIILANEAVAVMNLLHQHNAL